MKRMSLLLLVFFFLFTAACGNGGGNTPAEPSATSAATSAPIPDTRYVRWAVTEDRTWSLTCADADYGWGKLCLLGEQEGKPVLLYGDTEPQAIALDRSCSLVAAGLDCVWLGAEKDLVCLNSAGVLALSLTLSDKAEDLTCDGEGNLWAAHRNALTMVRADGSTETVSLPRGFTAGTLCRLGTGGIGVIASRIKGDVAYIYRLSAEDMEPKPMEGSPSSSLFFPGDGAADFYYTKWTRDKLLSEGQQVFRFSGGGGTAVFDLAGLEHEGQLRGVYPEGADFLVLYSTADAAGLLRLTRTDTEKKVLTIGRVETNNIINVLISRFNAENPDYYLVSRFYYEEDGETRLNLDILAGDRPDLLSGSAIGMEVYAAKGLLRDLYPDLEREGLREDLIPGALKVLESGSGKLTQLCPDLIVYTCAEPQRFVGDADRWTTEDLERICAENPNLTLYGNQGAHSCLNMLLCGILDRFADLEKQELHFDSPEFAAFLDLMLEMQTRAANFSNNWDYADGDVLLCPLNFMSVHSYAQLMAELDLETLQITGVPAEGGTGVRLYAPNRFAIMEGTGNEEAAWAFMHWFLQEDMQELMVYLPIRQSVLEAQLEKAREGTPETIETRYVDASAAAAGTNMRTETVTIPAVPGLTEDQIAILQKSLGDVEGLYYDDMNHPCYNLIYQELRDFFNGKKTSAETAASIQAKMAIYLAERG